MNMRIQLMYSISDIESEIIGQIFNVTSNDTSQCATGAAPQVYLNPDNIRLVLETVESQLNELGCDDLLN